MDIRDELALKNLGNEPVWIAIHHKPQHAAEAASFFQQPYRFHFVDTIVAQAPADRVTEATSSNFYVDGEILDGTMAQRVVEMLSQLSRVSTYQSMRFVPLAVLNISVGVPKHLINKRRSGEQAIARAYRHVMAKLDVPIVASAGNDGPEAGLMNLWATTEGTIAASAADRDGTRVWERSSRPTSANPDLPYHLFSAHGEDTVGAFPRGATKSAEMIEAERRIDLPKIVGADKVDYYSVRSGTSFAAANISRNLCHVHQLIETTKAYASWIGHVRYNVPPFVRGYLDSGIDEGHPAFEKRLVNMRMKYGGLIIDIDVDRKRKFLQFFGRQAINIDLKYGHRTAVRFLKAIARPIPGDSARASGLGFVSHEAAVNFIRTARYSTLVTLLSSPHEERSSQWLTAAQEANDPLLLSTQEANSIVEYCQNYDLMLMLPLGSE